MKNKLSIIFLVITLLTSPSVYAWTTSHLQTYYQNSDAFYNYDFESESVSNTNVDFPVNLVFWNNAEVDKVKGAFYGVAEAATRKYMKLKDGSSWVWDSDRGSDEVTTGSKRKHMRLYADSDDRMYDIEWGYYVIATSHYDYPWYGHIWCGYSEQAEEEIAEDAEDIDEVLEVEEDKKYMYNLEPARNETEPGEPTHVWYNNGWTTFIKME
ncbi:MAG: hypothetical protein DRN88_01465 [Candidatus Hydrothermarchaeota archaeon]|nr:MAG: hypothetical protein DRN88_01465 [Candidatus Hydrothermarchaeota archaeon]